MAKNTTVSMYAKDRYNQLIKVIEKNINNDATQKAIPSQILLREGVKNL